MGCRSFSLSQSRRKIRVGKPSQEGAIAAWEIYSRLDAARATIAVAILRSRNFISAFRGLTSDGGDRRDNISENPLKLSFKE